MEFSLEEIREYSLSFFCERTFPEKTKLIEFQIQMGVKALEKDDKGNTKLEFIFQPQKLYCWSGEAIHEYDISAPPTRYDGCHYLMTQNFDTTGSSAYDFENSGQVTVSLEDGWPISVEMTQITNAELGTDKNTSEERIKISASGTTQLELISVNGKPYLK
jgi:hypothetical protein